jgi:antitoxin CcdA
MSAIREARPVATRKRPVNLSLNEELVDRARALTDKPSAEVEDWLRQYVNERNETLRVSAREADRIASMWNAFNDQHGSFADEHSTL